MIANGTSEGSMRVMTESGASPPSDVLPLSFHVKEALERYFTALNGHAPGGLYELVLTEIERPLLEEVMQRTRGNISKAAQHLGLNRATLRKKLEKHGIPS